VLAAQGSALHGNYVQANGGQWRRLTLIVIATMAVPARRICSWLLRGAPGARDRGIRRRARLGA